MLSASASLLAPSDDTALKPSQEKKNDTFALFPNAAPDVWEKDKLRLEQLALRRKEEEEKELKYKSEASKRKVEEEKLAKKLAREEKYRQEQEAAWAAERDRRMLLLILARRDAEARGMPFDEEEYLEDLQQQERRKQEEILQKQTKPNKLHIKEIMAVVDGQSRPSDDMGGGGGGAGKSTRTPPRTPTRLKKDPRTPTKDANQQQPAFPKPKKVLRDLSAITAEQRAEARRALVRQTFEAARKKGKVPDGHNGTHEGSPPSAEDEADKQLYAGSSEDLTSAPTEEELSAAMEFVRIDAAAHAIATATSTAEECDVDVEEDVVLEPVVDRELVERALQQAKGRVDGSRDDEEAALLVAMAMLDQLSADTADEMELMAGGGGGGGGGGGVDTARTDDMVSVPTDEASFTEPTASMLTKTSSAPVSPSRTGTSAGTGGGGGGSKDPLRLAIAAARRLAVAERRPFNEEDFTRVWLEMEAQASLPSAEETSLEVLPPVPPTEGGGGERKEKDRDPFAMDRMRLALVAAKKAAFEGSRPWDEDQFKRDYWTREDEAEEATRAGDGRRAPPAALREAKMRALAQAVASRDQIFEPNAPPISPSSSSEGLDDVGVRSIVTQFQTQKGWAKADTSPTPAPGRLVQTRGLSAQLASAMQGDLDDSTSGGESPECKPRKKTKEKKPKV